MMRCWLLFMVLGLMAMTAMGCQAGGARAVEGAGNPAVIGAGAYDAVYDASREVLRDFGFRLDRMDYRFGQVTTQPKDSPTAAEFWSRDNTTSHQAWQSTLSHQRRTVRVSLEPWSQTRAMSVDGGGEGDYLLRVEVLMERRQMPVRRLNGSITRGMFTTLSEVPAELAERGITASYWEPIGRDIYLENRLVREILERAVESRE